MTEKQYEELAAAITKVRELMKDTDVICIDISKNIRDTPRVLLSHVHDKTDWLDRPFSEKSDQKVKIVNGVEFFVLVDK